MGGNGFHPNEGTRPAVALYAPRMKLDANMCIECMLQSKKFRKMSDWKMKRSRGKECRMEKGQKGFGFNVKWLTQKG